MADAIDDGHDHELPSAASSVGTFALLAALTAVQLAVGFSDLGHYKLPVALLVAVTQAGVLSVLFMDLRQADKLTWLVAGASLFWVGLMFLFILTDYLTRWYAAY